MCATFAERLQLLDADVFQLQRQRVVLKTDVAFGGAFAEFTLSQVHFVDGLAIEVFRP